MKPWKLFALFTPSEVTAAFAALHHRGDTLFPSAPSDALARFAHRRHSEDGYRRDHLEMPLQHLYDRTSVYGALPAEVRRICEKLHDAALQHVEEARREPSFSPLARAEVTHDLGKKSVLRVLRYPVGSGCRPHVDPGLCTALLVGSAGGLEVNTRDTIPVSCTRRPGDYTVPQQRAASEGAAGMQRENALDLLPHWEPVVAAHAGDAVVMTGNMMGVLSAGALPGVLHRVRKDWGESSGERRASSLPCCADATVCRFNIIVELRPAQAKRWYTISRAAGTDARRG